eukprot:7382100-Prymnesium_polylepis.1
MATQCADRVRGAAQGRHAGCAVFDSAGEVREGCVRGGGAAARSPRRPSCRPTGGKGRRCAPGACGPQSAAGR